MINTTDKKVGFLRRHWVILMVALIFVASLGYLWVSKDWALKKQAISYEAKAEIAKKQAQRLLDSIMISDLELTTKSLTWAVRSELVRENYEQVGLYFNQFIKAERVDEINLIRPDGTIWLSSNKKSEGNEFTGPQSSLNIHSERMVVDTSSSDIVEITAPIMSLDSKLGSLAVKYRREN